MKAIVHAVFPDSEAAEAGIVPGDIIENINGHVPEDELDFRFYACDDIVTLTVLKKDGSREQIEFEEPENPDLGIQFSSALFGNAKRCTNNCIFCFIDQLPPGMRETLYFKDDDARLSFLTGNYITLTNVKDTDIDKVIRMRLAPINISVHTTDPALRCKMLHNRHAGKALRYIQRLYDGALYMNGQIVLVPGYNDGAALDKTIGDLSRYAPYMQSVSVVPVGITRYRDGLPSLDSFTKETAEAVLRQITKWQERLLAEIGTRFIYASDEFYLLAGWPIPSDDAYEGYAQIENGVGLLRSMEDEFTKALETAPSADPRHVSLVTGKAAYGLMRKLAHLAMEKCPELRIDVHCVINTFFGEKITVAGLLTGQDIAAQLTGKDLGEVAYIPSAMLRHGTDVFLDDMTVSQLSQTLGTPVCPVECDGFTLWDTLRKDELA
ncbi:MAG: DUF512 domain-containing protein [Ruminococcaceae bacterium]|nr:DUF512 domain-containing protein [Oscillospiraceae bacterium]